MKDNLQPKKKKSGSIDPQGTEYLISPCMPY